MGSIRAVVWRRTGLLCVCCCSDFPMLLRGIEAGQSREYDKQGYMRKVGGSKNSMGPEGRIEVGDGGHG